MNKKELKKVLKPLIKECIKEVIFEDGTLSTIISEVMKGTSKQPIVTEASASKLNHDSEKSRKKHLLEQKKKMLDAIGREAYNGVDLFEGTTPLSTRSENPASPHGSNALDGVDPGDSGVDLSGFGMSSNVWKKLAGN